MKEYFKLLNPRGLKSLTFFVTGRCNARCNFCFYWRHNVNRPELSLDDIRRISGHLPKFFWLWLSGGEPFLRDDLPELCRIFVENNGVTNVQIPTNGLLTEKIVTVTEEVLRQCPGVNLLVIVSLDDLGEKHDEIRGVKGIYGKAVETVRRLKELQAKHLKLSAQITTTMTSFNQDRIVDIYRAARQMVKSVRINLVRGDTKEGGAKAINIERYVALHRCMLADHDTYSGYPFPVSAIVYAKDAVQREIIVEIFRQKRRFLPCKALRSSIVLDETGSVFPCEILPDRLGDLRETDYETIRKTHGKLAHYIETECFCTHECSLTSSILYTPRYMPRLVKHFFWYLLKLPRRAEPRGGDSSARPI